MSVTIDHQPLEANELGLKTVGQVLSHIQSQKRVVVHVLLDGQEPDLDDLPALRAAPLLGHTLFIETSEPKRIALDCLQEIEWQLADADRMTSEAVQFLRENQNIKAMERLRGCFSTWQDAQESLIKIAQLLRIELSRIMVDGRSFVQVLSEFGQQLKLIKTALENRDFVSLVDVLVYEMADSAANWRAAIRSMRTVIGA